MEELKSFIDFNICEGPQFFSVLIHSNEKFMTIELISTKTIQWFSVGSTRAIFFLVHLMFSVALWVNSKRLSLDLIQQKK